MRNNDKHISIFLYKGILLGAVLAALIGCGSTASSRLYTLVSLTSSGEETPVVANENPLTVKVGPLQLPKYLDRPQIVTRLGPNEVSPSTIDRWAEPLKAGVLRAMEDNLLWYLEPQDIVAHPWSSLARPDYAIQMGVAQFERNAEGDAELLATWTVRPAATGRRSAIIETRIVEPVDPPSTDELVNALSRALARLSSEVADTVRAMHGRAESQ